MGVEHASAGGRQDVKIVAVLDYVIGKEAGPLGEGL